MNTRTQDVDLHVILKIDLQAQIETCSKSMYATCSRSPRVLRVHIEQLSSPLPPIMRCHMVQPIVQVSPALLPTQPGTRL